MGIVAPSWLPELEKGYQEEILDDRLLAQHLSAVLNGHGSSSGSEVGWSRAFIPFLSLLHGCYPSLFAIVSLFTGEHLMPNL